MTVPNVKTITINRSEIEPREFGQQVLNEIWEARRRFILDNMREPSLIVVSYRIEDALFRLGYQYNISALHIPCGSKDNKKIFGTRFIASNDLVQDEILIA
jgi:hypothetical protein